MNREDITDSIQNYSPDLILLDVALGGANGRKICKKLKMTGETKDIPVILFSAQYYLINNMIGCMGKWPCYQTT